MGLNKSLKKSFKKQNKVIELDASVISKIQNIKKDLDISSADDSKIHKLSLDVFCKKLNVDLNSGLSNNSVCQRLSVFGFNKLSEQKKTPAIIKFLRQFKNFFAILLLVGALLSFVSEFLSPGQGSIYIAWALFGVSFLNAFFTYLQESKAEKVMSSFKNLITTKNLVIRDGKEVEIDSDKLVPGDILVLREGDKISADARIVEIFNLKVDHSSLTGESEPQLRSLNATHDKPVLSRNMVFSGTLVQTGSGKAVVVSTGDNTKIGEIAKLTREVETPESHLQKELGQFVRIISYIAVILGITFFLMGFGIGNNIWINLVFAIGIIVANVPEGLLPTVTLTLSIAAQKMAKNKALVKNIDAIETLGSLTVICSDKTGTLTENKLNTISIFMNNSLYEFDNENKVFNTSIRKVSKKYDAFQIAGFLDASNILIGCNNSQFDSKTKKSSGDPTEICMREFVSNFTNHEYQQKKLKRIYEIPFESSKKYMITAHEIGHEKRSFLKGAPEVVIKKCDSIFINGKIHSLSSSYIKNFIEKNNEFSSQGYRVLAFAQKKISYNFKSKQFEKNLEKNDYVLYGLIIMQDPPRSEVADAVLACQKAGIKIVVISGDQGNTVLSIAKQVGIVNSNDYVVITSDELKKMNDSDLKKVLKNDEIIFARSLPEDKERIVKTLQSMGEIVAVTGDGVNDAPALKRADVGIAMNISGTEVAKDAADVVLLDDNFVTISKAIKYGRTVYDNIQSFVMYILTSNIPEILPYLFFVILSGFNWPLALTVLLILAIDLGTDMLPAISLGVESPADDVMNKPPRDPKAKLANYKMFIRSYGFQGPLETLFAFIVFFRILFDGGWSFAQKIPATNNPIYMSAVTGFFTTIIVMQMFNLFSCRTSTESVFKKGLFSNKLAFVGILTETALLLSLIFVKPIGLIFGTTTFPIKYVGLMIFGGILLFLAEELRKYLVRKYGILRIR
jgi:sodium/potassium-transporting ATPase subunit alpha